MHSLLRKETSQREEGYPERLFPMAKRVYNPHRRGLHPKTVQALLFLNQNMSLGSLPLLAKIVNDRSTLTDDDDEESSEEN
jgi:hypothetical protein